MAALVPGTAVGSSGGTSTQNVKIALVYQTDVPADAPFGQGAQAAANQFGFHLSIVGPSTYNVSTQQQLSNSEANAGANGIMEILVGATPWTRNISALESRHIAVADIGVYTGPFLGKNTPIYVGPSDKAYGRALGNLVVQGLGPNAHGSVVVATCAPGLLEQVQRFEGVQQAMRAKEPGIKVVGMVYAADSYTEGLTDWQRIVLANPDARAFIGLCSTAPAVLARVRASDHGKWLISGGELDPNTLLGIKDGLIYGVVDAEIWQQGYIGARLLYEEITNPHFTYRTGWVNTGVETVTKTNIDAVMARQSSQAAQIAANEPLDDAIFAHLNLHVQTLSASQS
jgi:ABC-type sugar transport system substrate-binding protein